MEDRMTLIEKIEFAICSLVVYLVPLYLGFVFFKIKDMGGVPSWVLIGLGVLFAASLGQAVFFLLFGLKEAHKKSFSRKGRNR